MTPRTKTLVALLAAPFVVAGVFACGEEGQAIGEGQCTEPGQTLPLYRWVFSDAGGWNRISPSTGKPITNAEKATIERSYKSLPNNGRCQTPPGYAVSYGQAAGTGGAKTGTGGASSGGAGNKDSGGD